jgi:osmoprotectant transport system ATP-binding protein
MSGLPTAAAALGLCEVTKRYRPDLPPAVDGLTLDVPAGEVCVLVGPSGCGKSTALRMINRLIEPTSGEITIDGRNARSLAPAALRRRIGYVIQQVGLLPHLSVAANVATVPRLLGWDRARTAERVAEMLELVGLPADEFGRRYPGELSGGQQQRIGLARALAGDPPLMLMDEPFSAVDPITRERLQGDFLQLHRRVPKTVVFVTHDIDEAVRMADRIAVMRAGRLVQYAPPTELLARPADDFVRDFVGADRALKRLSLIRLEQLDLPASSVDAGSMRLGRKTSLRDALSALLDAGADRATVVDEHDRPVASVDVATIAAAAHGSDV